MGKDRYMEKEDRNWCERWYELVKKQCLKNKEA
jgi:hypothetical protein